MTFEEAKEAFLDTENYPQPISLQEAAGAEVEDFYLHMVQDGFFCIETPKGLWPQLIFKR
jgi:hypothetical protein